jgi:hypothetical protein
MLLCSSLAFKNHIKIYDTIIVQENNSKKEEKRKKCAWLINRFLEIKS